MPIEDCLKKRGHPKRLCPILRLPPALLTYSEVTGARQQDAQNPHEYSVLTLCDTFAKLLIRGAATATNQKVGSSNLSGRAIFRDVTWFRATELLLLVAAE